MILPRQRRFKLPQPIATFIDYSRIDLFRELCRGGAVTGAERKDMDFAKTNLFGDSAGLGKIGLCLAGKTDNDVGRESGLVQRLLDSLTALQETAAPVAPLHESQDPVRAALQT